MREKNHWSFHDLLLTFVNILMLTLISVFAYAYQAINELKRNSVHVTDVVQYRINIIILLSSVFFLMRHFLLSLSPPLQSNLKGSQLHKAQTPT